MWRGGRVDAYVDSRDEVWRRETTISSNDLWVMGRVSVLGGFRCLL
jgi:hypothetical protein